jgi:uncharacterized protein DUF6875
MRAQTTPAKTTHLFLLEDLADVSRTREIAESDLDALRAVADWIKTFVARPHKDLGRAGPVCPFVPGAWERQTLWLAPEEIADQSVQAVVQLIPTVCLYVTSLVASSYGYNKGEIEHRVAHEFTAHVATQRGRTERRQHRHPPRAQPVAPLRGRHGGRPRLPPRRCTEQSPHREQGHLGRRTRDEKRPNRFKSY